MTVMFLLTSLLASAACGQSTKADDTAPPGQSDATPSGTEPSDAAPLDAASLDAAPPDAAPPDAAPLDAAPSEQSISAWPYDEDLDCFGDLEIAGRILIPDGPESLDCDDAMTYALSPERHCWLFSNGCIPDGFTTPAVTLDQATPHERACTEGADLCANAACAANEVHTQGAGCLSCGDAHLGLYQALEEYLESSGGLDCSVDEDCVAEPWEVACGGQCPRALAAQAVESFHLELAKLDADFCGDPTWVDRCGVATPDCAEVDARCVEGRCVSSM